MVKNEICIRDDGDGRFELIVKGDWDRAYAQAALFTINTAMADAMCESTDDEVAFLEDILGGAAKAMQDPEFRKLLDEAEEKR